MLTTFWSSNDWFNYVAFVTLNVSKLIGPRDTWALACSYTEKRCESGIGWFLLTFADFFVNYILTFVYWEMGHETK